MTFKLNKLFLTGAFIFGANALLSSAYAETAYLAPHVKDSLLLDIDGSNPTVIVGERGHILLGQSAEGGALNDADFKQVSVPTKTTLTAVTQVNDKVWAVGHDASILHSSDKGNTWLVQLSMPELDRPFLDLVFFNEQEGIAVGAYGLFYRTEDGGVTWEKELHASVLPQDDIDYLESIKDDQQFYEEELSFILPHFNRLSVKGGLVYMAGEAGMLAVSEDKGRSWKRFDIDYMGSFFDVSSLGNGHILAVGLRGNAFVKQVESEQWERLETCVTTSLNSIILGNEQSTFVTGNNGVVLAIDNQKVMLDEVQAENEEGCAMHTSMKRIKNELNDAILNGRFINDAILAVTASGIKKVEIN
ncbi:MULTISPECIES: YCF48-related protein [Alteromonadaceae]|jgi:photosystem II stability/assembly factor-like uncharacterized protein|uniref:Sialidase n=1 Tax=Brumicola blandensis TaxID=3075611 RepID=A0AAW8R165_9ALTE|nr:MULTISPECIES: YCF48-related protein [unclassified Alteromonas]MDT0581580.1 sialidase [Alteromonas sp. W409]MDT0627155.1 sialidase [Alteromonas sp. W364]